MSTQIAEAKTRLDTAPAPLGVPSGSSSNARSSSSSLEYENRTAAILMHLLEPIQHGTVLTDEQNKARMEASFGKGNEVLVQCGVVDSTYSQPASMPNGKGCTLDFISHSALQLARSCVAATASPSAMQAAVS